MRFRAGIIVLSVMFSWCAGIQADDEPTLRLNDFGGVGLIQTPTARFAPDGSFGATLSRTEPLRRYILSLQMFPLLELSLRYTDIRNKPYSSQESFSGDQTYKDRGIDLKLLLSEERKYIPQIAIGLRDVGGTGLFAGEYLVASKQIADFDLTLGMAWGVPGSNGNLRNPLTFIANRFGQRVGSDAGVFSTSFFHGETIGVFGGVSYKTPVNGLNVNVEYDSTRYDPSNNVSLEADSQINASVDYAVRPWLNTAIGFERGNTLMWRATMHTNFNKRSLMPDLAPPPVAVLPDPSFNEIFVPVAAASPDLRSVVGQEWQDLVFLLAEQSGLDVVSVEIIGDALQLAVENNGFDVIETDEYLRLAQRIVQTLLQTTAQIHTVKIISLELGQPQTQTVVAVTPQPLTRSSDARKLDDTTPDDLFEKLKIALKSQRIDLVGGTAQENRLKLFISRRDYRNSARAVGRVMRAVISSTPPHYQEVHLVFVENGLSVHEVQVFRNNFIATALNQQSPDELSRQITHVKSPTPLSEAGYVPSDTYPVLNYSLLPKTRQSLGRPEQFLTYQVYLNASAELAFSPSFSIDGALGRDIVNNFDNLKIPSDSVLPHVRSDIAQYLREGKNGITNIKANYLFNIMPHLYGRLTAGLLEEMYGGLSGEVLYHAPKSSWAFGFDLNAVRQRDYDQVFSFRNYQTMTGHATVYYNPSFLKGVTIKVPFGRYLARDFGVTLDISRKFDSGYTVGAFVTKTDVPAEEFGEGSFDKGIYLSIPLDQILPTTSRSHYGILYRPLTRDGGQRVAQNRPLYDIVVVDSQKNFDSLFDLFR